MEAFPTEVTRLIILHIVDIRTLAIVARCSSKYRTVAESILYHSLRASKRRLPRHANHFTTYPHLANHLRIIRVLEEELSSQTVEVAAAESVGRILQVASNVEELYYPGSSNGAHGESVFQHALCFTSLRVLRCHFRNSEKAIGEFVDKCTELEDLELTPSFGEYVGGWGRSTMPWGDDRRQQLLPLHRNHKLRRLCVPAEHMMHLKDGTWLRSYIDESDREFGTAQLRHLSTITGSLLTALDVENLPEDEKFLYDIADMLPNLRFLASPSVFTDTMYEPSISHQHNIALLDVLSKLSHLQKVLLRGNHDDERQPVLLYDFIDRLKQTARPRSITNSHSKGGILKELRVVMIWAPESREQWGTTFLRGEGESGRVVDGWDDWEEHLNIPMMLMDKTKSW